MGLSTNLSVFASGSPFGRSASISWRFVLSVCGMGIAFNARFEECGGHLLRKQAGLSSPSLLPEDDRQIVRGHLTDFRRSEAMQHSAAGDILHIAQAPFRIARTQLPVESLVAR